MRSQSSRFLSKVCSALKDLGSRSSSTGASSRPVAMAQSQTPPLPKAAVSSPGDRCARSPTVSTPSSARTFWVLGPTPGIFPTGRGARKASASSGRITVIPSGFSMSEAILAMDLLGAIPMEQVRPTSRRTAFLMRRARARPAS